MSPAVQNTLLASGILTFVGLVVDKAVTRSRMGDTRRRVRALEVWHEQMNRSLGADFVPRKEVEAYLKLIDEKVSATNALIRAGAGVSSGLSIRAIEAAAAAPLTIPQAIARQEGFGKLDTRATRNNNPGNLDYEPWMEEHYGARLETPLPGEEARFATFPNGILGLGALIHTLQLPMYHGLTIRQMIALYAPSNENDTAVYQRNLCVWTGLSPDTVIDDYLS